MSNAYSAIVIGGGCLGTAAAVSISRRLRKTGRAGRVCLIEKRKIASGISARHSGIMRCANAVPAAAMLARRAAEQWRNLEHHWGVPARFEECGAMWIARDDDHSKLKWAALQQTMEQAEIEFRELSSEEARASLPACVNLYDGERYFREPGAFQFDPADTRTLLYHALRENDVEVREGVAAAEFTRAETGDITSVLTDDGERLDCEQVVNAAGAWSPSIFSSLGISIPVGIEAVNVVNWLASGQELSAPFPVIADYVNLAYFRLWRGTELHMHQPRKRAPHETSRAFAQNPVAVTGADLINDPSNLQLGHENIKAYEAITQHRFQDFDTPTYSSGYRSFFDITPDLKFILGPDHRITNLIHCLGAGQSFKYTPVFGEMMADFAVGGTEFAALAKEFSIARFDESYMRSFWAQASMTDHLEARAVGL